MKFLVITILIGIITLNKGYSLDSDFYKDLYVAETDLEALSKQSVEEGILKKVLESQVKRVMHRFYNEKMRGEDLAKDFEVFIATRPIDGIGDMIQALKEFLSKIVGSKAADVILKVLTMEDTRKAIEDVYYGYQDMQDPIKCDKGFERFSGGISHLVAVVLVSYYFAPPTSIFLSPVAAMVARQSMILINDITDLPKFLCDLIHRRRYEIIFSY